MNCSCLIFIPHRRLTMTKSPRQSGMRFIYIICMQSEFRNQKMVFTIMLLEALNVGHGQFLMEGAPHKDTYGSNRFIELWWVWDIAHWNRHYPQLPRLVNYDPILHDQYNISKRHFYRQRYVARRTTYYLNIISIGYIAKVSTYCTKLSFVRWTVREGT